jgi:hypothetical protein
MTDVVAHRLSLSVRFLDHFSGAVVPDELPVRLADGVARPVPRPGGGGARQADGSYRFRNLPGGTARLLWREPFTRSQAGWTAWTDDPEIVLPRPDPTRPFDVELWPTAAAKAPSAATGVRGKLTGAAVDGLVVRIARQGQPFDRFTRSDAAGEFLFLTPGALTTNPAGLVPLTIEVRTTGGVPRPVVGGAFVPAVAGAAFAGANFTVAPRSVPRIVFQLA